MEFTIDLRKINATSIFEKAINSKTPNLFIALRDETEKQLKKIIKECGIKDVYTTQRINYDYKQHEIELDKRTDNLAFDFCKECDVSALSIDSVNYIYDLKRFPSLDVFFKINKFSIGNIGFFITNNDYTINIIPSESLIISGYSYCVSSKKRKSYIALFGIHFSYKTISSTSEHHQKTDIKNLMEIQIGHSFFPAIFMCRNTGSLYTCTCFKGMINWRWDFYRFSRTSNPKIRKKIKRIKYIDNICFLCTGKKPQITYPACGISSFIQRYHPYISLECKRRYGDIFAFLRLGPEFENEMREKFNIFKIGERWKHETILYKTICRLYPNEYFIFHYRGLELEGLELDIFYPKYNIGIEYQGEQHFFPVAFWGGKSAYKKRVEHDIKKQNLCQKLGYILIQFLYTDKLSDEFIKNKLDIAVKSRLSSKRM